MGKQIAALNVGAAASAVRTVPLQARPPPPRRPRLPRHGRAPFLVTRPAHTHSRAQDGLALLSAALGTWSHFAKFKEFCETKAATAFTRDLWQQLGRFAQLVRPSLLPTHAPREPRRSLRTQTQDGTIAADLSNYDDEDTGAGNAWPCMIDDFAEWYRAQPKSDEAREGESESDSEC